MKKLTASTSKLHKYTLFSIPMAGSCSSNPPSHDASASTQQHLEFLYASNANVFNFVSVKLSGEHNYHLWKMQILCLMETYNMQGIVDATFIRPRKQYDSLIKGWIFGSVSEEILATIVHLGSAKEVWDKLKSFYDPTMISPQQEWHAHSASMKLEAETNTKDKVRDRASQEIKTEDEDGVLEETKTEEKDRDPTETRTKTLHLTSLEKETETKNHDMVPTETKAKGKQTKREDTISTYTEKKDEHTKTKGKNKIKRNKELRRAIVEGRWADVESTLREDKSVATEAINSDGNTVLHIAVGVGHSNLVSDILSLKGIQLPKMINFDGSTALHIAAIVGNTRAAELLIKKDKSLLEIPDNKGETPLDKAYENMHLDTIEYLLKAAIDDGKNKKKSSPIEDSLSPGVKIGVNLLVNAVSAKQYDLAIELAKKFPEFVVENDNVLMAIARTFPSGLGYGETLIYPMFDDNYQRIVKTARKVFQILVDFFEILKGIISDIIFRGIKNIALLVLFIVTMVPVAIFLWMYYLSSLLIWIVYFPFFTFYFLLWKVSTRLVAPVKHIEKKKKEWEEAKELLKLVCDEIDKLEFLDVHPCYYTRPVLEAARQNAYEVVDEILMRSPEAIRYKDKSGYDIIQLAVIHRSEKIYNLIYIIGERKSVYRMIEDSSKNNMLHLAGRLAPSHKLKLRTGAALQLQRELQWREEVKKLVFPAYITKENIFMETPDMIFTKEHENLVKEGEKWMKTVAESCSITAALITTIVFAAAITVPGGSNQNNGIPFFTKDFAFTIFAISDAVSLFASTTALLMFQSILTGRFSEQDFLVSLPRRLIIGLCTLMLSTTFMITAFGATLFLVFCHKKPWMLAPICVLAFLPILSFGTLQIPLIVDLFRSTYKRIFGKQSNKISHRFNPDDIRLFFGK